MARPTTQPAHPASASQEDQGTDHRKMRIIGASDIRVPSGPSTNHIGMPRWGPCSKAWTSRPIWLGSRLNSLLRGLWRPRRRSHSAQRTTHALAQRSGRGCAGLVLPSCCHPPFSHFVIISAARFGLLSTHTAPLLDVALAFIPCRRLRGFETGNAEPSRMQTYQRRPGTPSARFGPDYECPEAHHRLPKLSQPSKIQIRFLEQRHCSSRLFVLQQRTASRDDLTANEAIPISLDRSDRRIASRIRKYERTDRAFRG